jgi:hypothetical protein
MHDEPTENEHFAQQDKNATKTCKLSEFLFHQIGPDQLIF